MKRKTKSSKPLRLYTHTHTHTDVLFNGRKIGVAVLVVIAIICGIVFFINKNGIMKNGMMFNIIGRNKIGEGAELNSYDAFFSSSNVRNSEAVDTSKWDLERVNIVYDTENVPVPVPKGFTASGATGEHTVNTGFVIYEGEGEVNDENAWNESCTRNQFVWVPVYDTSRVYEEIGTTGKKKAKLWNFTATGRTIINNSNTDDRGEPGITKSDKKGYFAKYGMQGYTLESLYKELDIAFEKSMESLDKYGGYYIGRYETGNTSSLQPVVQRLNNTVTNQSWYEMYERTKKISDNENIELNMIWGCLWDETLEWLIDSGNRTQEEIASDSGTWGNYRDVEIRFINSLGIEETKRRDDAFRIPTGSSDHTKANNIYDLAGNAYEMTLELYGIYSTKSHIFRGSGYNVSHRKSK